MREIRESNGKFWLVVPLSREGISGDSNLFDHIDRWHAELEPPYGPFLSREEAEDARHYEGIQWSPEQIALLRALRHHSL